MKKNIKRVLLFALSLISLVLWYSYAQVWLAPSYHDNFSQYFTSNVPMGNDGEIIDVISFEWVSEDNDIRTNIRCLFYPSTYNACGNVNRWWAIWDVMRYVWYALVVLFIVISWIKLLVSGSNGEKVKSSIASLWYIIAWSLLFFWCIWILWSVLKFETVSWTDWLVNNLKWSSNSLLFFILSFAKALAFIVAILMIVVHWFKMMASSDKSDKVKIWLKWLLNVIIALVIIKLIDYIYYMAQLNDLVSRTTDLIIEIAKIAWFIIWALMVIMLFYAGFLFITDQWSSENMKKAKNIIVWILVTAVVIFALLLIIYEVFREFA